jgi:hypothetical protein
VSTYTSRLDLEEIEITNTEKLLALVLIVFFLIGGMWAYAKVDNVVRSEIVSVDTYFTADERAAVDRASDAQRRLEGAEQALALARTDLELARERYRTALDANQPPGELEAAYRAAESRYSSAQAEVDRAGAEVTATRPAADAAYSRAGREANDASFRGELITFLARLAMLLATLGVSYWLLIRLRRSGSRYLPVAFALVGFAALFALIMSGDYVGHHIDVEQLGPLVLSIVGIALTLGAFWWLQRYLARRIPQRRVRKGECPFCGYPARGGDHCEGCGRSVVGECAACHEPRRVGAFHCGACGSA